VAGFPECLGFCGTAIVRFPCERIIDETRAARPADEVKHQPRIHVVREVKIRCPVRQLSRGRCRQLADDRIRTG
jgi:hypothetical protein